MRAYGAGRVRKRFLGRDTSAPTMAPKKINKLNDVERAIWASRYHILAPSIVIHAELAGTTLVDFGAAVRGLER